MVHELSTHYSATLDTSENPILLAEKHKEWIGLVFRALNLPESILEVYGTHAKPILESYYFTVSDMVK